MPISHLANFAKNEGLKPPCDAGLCRGLMRHRWKALDMWFIAASLIFSTNWKLALLRHFSLWYLLGAFTARFFQNHRKSPGRATRAHTSSIWGTAGKLLMPATSLQHSNLKKIEFWRRAPFLRKSLTRPKKWHSATNFQFFEKMKDGTISYTSRAFHQCLICA